MTYDGSAQSARHGIEGLPRVTVPAAQTRAPIALLLPAVIGALIPIVLLAIIITP